MLGALTIGNATLVAYDGDPIIATDPGSATRSQPILAVGHSPTRSPPSVERISSTPSTFGSRTRIRITSTVKLASKKILLGDHVGGRLVHDLREMGFDVAILPDRKWVQLSPRIKVFCITTHIQDSILLVDVNGYLFVDLNDASDRDCTLLLRRIIASALLSAGAVRSP